MDNDYIVVALTCFCLACTSELKSAGCDDMNGNMIYCKKCGKDVRIQVGISIHSNSEEDMRHCYEQMNIHHDLIKNLLAERNPS